LLLKNPNNLTKKDKVRLNETPRKGFKVEQHLGTLQVYGLVLEFKKIFDYKKPSYAAKYFLFFFISLGKLNLTPA